MELASGKVLTDPISGQVSAEAGQVVPSTCGVNLNFTIPEDVFNKFSKGDPSALIEIIKVACPKNQVLRPYADWKAITKRTNKVAILGFADSWNEAPFNDPTWEIWGLNSLFESLPRYDRWFEIHERKLYAWDTNKEIGYGLTRTGQPYMEALAQLKRQDGSPCPIYMVEAYPDIINAVRYPIEEMVTEFDPQKRKREWKEPFKGSYELDWNGYLTNSISYMIAIAIHDGYEEIGLYGIDMAQLAGGEYTQQRASCEYYIGIAAGKGIKVTIPNTSDLLKTRAIYGFEAAVSVAWKDKLGKIQKSMNDRYNGALQAFEGARKQLDQYIGAIECSKELDRIWGDCYMPSAEGFLKRTT